MNPILAAGAVQAAVGLAVAAMLVVAARAFHVPGSELIEEIAGILPGVNCGACGYAGCQGYAEALVKDGASPNKCIPGGASIIPLLHAALGESGEAMADVEAGTADVISGHAWPERNVLPEPRVAVVACAGGNMVRQRYRYVGLPTCAAAHQVGGGFKECYAGCQGLGDCVRGCPFDAIAMLGEVAVVDPARCAGCTTCVRTCPKGLIHMVPASAPVVLTCSNQLRGKQVSWVCPTGCIACNKCVKACPTEAVTMVENLPRIDYGACAASPRACVEACSSGCLVAGPAEAYARALRREATLVRLADAERETVAAG